MIDWFFDLSLGWQALVAVQTLFWGFILVVSLLGAAPGE